jgi:hypothetical protein
MQTDSVEADPSPLFLVGADLSQPIADLSACGSTCHPSNEP